MPLQPAGATAPPPPPPPRDPRRLDLTGERRGRLEVLGEASSGKGPGGDRVTYWRVRCACGEVAEMTARQFRAHEACPRCEHVAHFLETFRPREDQEFTLVGFNRFRPHRLPGRQGQYVWDCRCTPCGRTFELTSKHVKSARRCPACSMARRDERARGRTSGRRKNVAPPEMVEMLRASYDYTGADAGKARVAPTNREIALRFGWSKTAVDDLAVRLGLSRPAARPQRPWEQAEKEIVARYRRATTGRVKDVLRKAGFVRSRNEIADRQRQLDLLEHPPLYTAEEAADLLGLGGPAEVEALADAGKLRRPGGGPSLFTRAALREFLLNRPEDYRLARVNRLFFTLLVLRREFDEQKRGNAA